MWVFVGLLLVGCRGEGEGTCHLSLVLSLVLSFRLMFHDHSIKKGFCLIGQWSIVSHPIDFYQTQ